MYEGGGRRGEEYCREKVRENFEVGEARIRGEKETNI